MEILKAVVIHLVVPAAGVLLYLSIVRKMRDRQINKPPVISLFLVFATWGSLVVLVLTSFFWYWSGMATLGLAYLILLGPIVMIAIAVVNYLRRAVSSFHVGAFFASAMYVPTIIGVALGSNYWGVPFR